MSETYLYHRVPEDMKGTMLIPLNEMKGLDPERHAAKVAKYVGREVLMEKPIPPLNCLWNDVVFMTAVDPSVHKAALDECGLKNAASRKVKFYRIPLSKILHRDRLAAWYVDESIDESALQINDETLPHLTRDVVPYRRFEMFNTANIRVYGRIPELTKEYLRHMRRIGSPTFMPYLFVPHILYKGWVDTSDIETFEC